MSLSSSSCSLNVSFFRDPLLSTYLHNNWSIVPLLLQEGVLVHVHLQLFVMTYNKNYIFLLEGDYF